MSSTSIIFMAMSRRRFDSTLAPQIICFPLPPFTPTTALMLIQQPSRVSLSSTPAATFPLGCPTPGPSPPSPPTHPLLPLRVSPRCYLAGSPTPAPSTPAHSANTSKVPTPFPSQRPTFTPTYIPGRPTSEPTEQPYSMPSTSKPTDSPNSLSTSGPTGLPTLSLAARPSPSPTASTYLLGNPTSSQHKTIINHSFLPSPHNRTATYTATPPRLDVRPLKMQQPGVASVRHS